jgi:hypothetical protein
MQTGRPHHLNGPTKVKSQPTSLQPNVTQRIPAAAATAAAVAAAAAAVTAVANNSQHSDSSNSSNNSHAMKNTNSILNDFKTKTVLKEAVDAVVSSFAKHTQGYGRGTCPLRIFR